MSVETVAEWLEAEGIVPVQGPGALADVALVRRLLIAAAQAGHALSYSDVLARLGIRFTRPKMRALCRTLDAIDSVGLMRGEPALAVLVVRESDRLPGQGWWVGAAAGGYAGGWSGGEAEAHVRDLQDQAFAYWQAAR